MSGFICRYCDLIGPGMPRALRPLKSLLVIPAHNEVWEPLGQSNKKGQFVKSDTIFKRLGGFQREKRREGLEMAEVTVVE